MNPVQNPYTPGAGDPPPELAGRSEVLEAARISLERAKIGRSSKSIILVGLRGVGKTVLLDRIQQAAECGGVYALEVESPENRSLPAILTPQLRSALLKLSRREAARQLAHRALRALAGFAGALKVKYQDIELGLDFEPEPGLADNGDLETDLPELLAAVGSAAQADNTALALFIDELQYVPENQLSALIMSLHRAARRQVPVVMLGAGLPQVRGNLGKAKSYAERIFEFPQIGPLSTVDARLALTKPAAAEGVAISDEVLDAVISKTQCYPYFLQEWAKHLWDVADGSPISATSIPAATERAIAALDKGFFLVRFDRLTVSEKRYVRAMAELGPGPHRSRDIADALNRTVQSLAPTRSQLIAKGAIWSPGHGDTAFTVPMFDGFMRRIMPGDDWRQPA